MSIPAVLLAGAFLAAPGLGLAVGLFPPGKMSLPARVALTFPLGYASVGLLAFLLALMGLLYAPFFFVLYGFGTAAAWWFAVRRGAWRVHLRGLRQEVLGERWIYLLAAVVLLVLAAVRLTYSPVFSLGDQTPLRYWADGIEVADAHGVPAVTLQWGRLFPSTVSKVVLNSFHAAASFLLGRGPLVPMGALLVTVSVGLMLAAFALGRELGLRYTAVLLPILLFANRFIGNKELTGDLLKYRAENWGRLAVFAGIILAVRVLRSERFRDVRTEALLAGALHGVAVGTHLVSFVIGATFIGAYALMRLALDRRPLETLKSGAMMGAVGLGLGGFLYLSAPGDVGFQGAAAADVYERLGIEIGVGPDFDPTRYLATGQLEQPPHQGAGPFYNAPSRVTQFYVGTMIGDQAVAQRRPLLLGAVALLAVGTVLVWGSRDLRAMTGASILLSASLLVAALAFNYRYDVYVLAQFGGRRLFDYSTVPVALVGLGVLETVLGRLGGRLGLGGPRPWVVPAAAALIVLFVCWVAVPKAVAPRQRLPFLATALEPLEWIAEHVPCEGRILADRRTLATFEAMTGHAGVVEGMGPYLRPQVLVPAIREMLAARAFFQDPVGNQDYLGQRGVAAVVVTVPQHPIGGAHKLTEVDMEALDAAPFLRLATTSESLRVYSVASFDSDLSPDLPEVTGRPGYRCEATGTVATTEARPSDRA
ncbi:MAG: hypothetical protein ACRDIX_10150 [Actinomycetota bacterium]